MHVSIAVVALLACNGFSTLAADAATREPYAIIGAQSSSSSLPLRRNINALQSEGGPQW